MKKRRHKAILELIEEFNIGTQEELLALLREKGFDVTQATVSRDVKELRLLKSLDSDGVYKYTAEKNDTESYDGVLDVLFKASLTKVDFAGNICVLKCSPGLANAACATIDSMNVYDIVGTIAGDDTIFMLCRTADEAENLANVLNDMISK